MTEITSTLPVRDYTYASGNYYFPDYGVDGKWADISAGTLAERDVLLANGDTSTGNVYLQRGMPPVAGNAGTLPVATHHLQTTIDLAFNLGHTTTGVLSGQPQFGQFILGWTNLEFGGRVLSIRSDIDNSGEYQYPQRYFIVGDLYGWPIRIPYPAPSMRFTVRLGAPWAPTGSGYKRLVTATSNYVGHTHQIRPGITQVLATSTFATGTTTKSITTATKAGAHSSKGKFRRVK